MGHIWPHSPRMLRWGKAKVCLGDPANASRGFPRAISTPPPKKLPLRAPLRCPGDEPQHHHTAVDSAHTNNCTPFHLSSSGYAAFLRSSPFFSQQERETGSLESGAGESLSRAGQRLKAFCAATNKPRNWLTASERAEPPKREAAPKERNRTIYVRPAYSRAPADYEGMPGPAGAGAGNGLVLVTGVLVLVTVVLMLVTLALVSITLAFLQIFADFANARVNRLYLRAWFR
ncbi:unnamed protein product [Ectocarpus sp. 6 AP-2014]